MNEEIVTDSILFSSGPESDRVHLPVIHLLPAEGNITYEILDGLEADLDFSEKISLVFLLYGSVDLALQHLKKESYITQGSGSEYLPQSGLLSGWARSGGEWEERFLEALCIIQNFYVVERLGYNRDDMMQKFLPESPDTAMNVDYTRKVLYIFCEKLSMDKENDLIKRIEDEIGHQTPSFIRGNLKCMETFLLYLMSRKIILYDNGLKIITKHLKAMGEIGLHDFLEPLSSHPEVLNRSIQRSSDDDDASIAGINIASSIVSTANPFESTATKGGDRYKITNHQNIGVCVIINQKIFYSESDSLLEQPLEDRIGTDEDRDRLQEAFVNYGFTVQIWEDRTHKEMIEVVDFATKNLVKEYHSYFVLCILSHGRRGIVYGVNSKAVSIDEIHNKIQGKACPQLINKPKILLIQACQGDKCQEALSPPLQPNDDISSDGPSDVKMVKVPEISDSLIITSTIPGYVCYRDQLTGSWFIQSLCTHLLSATEDIDIRDVFLKVSNEVQRQETSKGEAMQPECKSTLKLKPYLPYCRPARKMVAKLMIKRIVFYELLKEYLSTERKHIAC